MLREHMDSTTESYELYSSMGTSPWDHQCHPVPLPSLDRSITSINTLSESLTSSTQHYNNIDGVPISAPLLEQQQLQSSPDSSVPVSAPPLEQQLHPLLHSSPDSSVPVSTPPLEQQLHPLLQSSPNSSVPVSAPPLEQQLPPLLLTPTYSSSSSRPDGCTVVGYTQWNESQWNDDGDILRKWRINRRLEEARQAVKSRPYSIHLPISTSSTDRAAVDSDRIKARPALRDLSEFRQSSLDNSSSHTAATISSQYHPHHCCTKPHKHCSTSFINGRYYSSMDTDNQVDLKEQCDPLTNATAIGNSDSSTVARQQSGCCCHSYYCCCCCSHQCTYCTRPNTSIPVAAVPDGNITTTSDCCNKPSPCCVSKQRCPTNTPSSTNDCLSTTLNQHQSNDNNSLQRQQQYLDYHNTIGGEHPDSTGSIVEDDRGRNSSDTEVLREEAKCGGRNQAHADIKQTSLNSTTSVANASLMDELVTQVVCDNLFKFTSNS